MGELLGGRAATLLDINEAAALKLLTRNVDVLPPSAVVPGLKVRSCRSHLNPKPLTILNHRRSLQSLNPKPSSRFLEDR